MIKLYKTYNKVKDVFVKPKLTWSFGFWRNQEGLPCWRNGNLIRLGKRGSYELSKDSTFYKAKYQWKESWKNKHKILSKIFKPVYELPIWLSFFIFNLDLCWKTKYGDYRYEFPPQFTIVFFGLALSFYLHCPVKGVGKDNDYWEAILWYIDKKDLKVVDKMLGCWSYIDGSQVVKRRLDKRFLKSEY